jgi:hypothetical protein
MQGMTAAGAATQAIEDQLSALEDMRVALELLGFSELSDEMMELQGTIGQVRHELGLGVLSQLFSIFEGTDRHIEERKRIAKLQFEGFRSWNGTDRG